MHTGGRIIYHLQWQCCERHLQQRMTHSNNWQAVEDFFNGKQYNGAASGESFRSYLNFLQREDISTGINNQLNMAQSQLSGLTDSFYQQVNADNTQMTLTYDELQKVVIHLKVDMLQAMNINVDSWVLRIMDII